MAHCNFEGDINNISDNQLQFINKVLLELGFENSKVTFTPVGEVGDNYGANVMRITVEEEYGTSSIIAKLAPKNVFLRQAINTVVHFKNEHKLYNEILPKFAQLQKDAGVPEEEQFKYAKCYGSLLEEPDEVILLEDLKPLGFIMLDRFKSLNNDAIKSVLKNFAAFHAMSYVLKEKEPEIYEEYKDSLTDTWVALGHNKDINVYLQHLEKDTQTIVGDPYYTSLLQDKIIKIIERATELSKAEYDSKYSVILQGDSWTNNILFKFKDNTLTESIMIDYQLSRNCSPVCDIMYLIFNCTDHEMRTQHFHHWMDYYHEELDKFLSYFNMRANVAYPRERMDLNLKRYSEFLLGLSIYLASTLLRNVDDAAKILKVINSENMIEQVLEVGVIKLADDSKKLYRNRVIGLIDSYKEFGWL